MQCAHAHVRASLCVGGSLLHAVVNDKIGTS